MGGCDWRIGIGGIGWRGHFPSREMEGCGAERYGGEKRRSFEGGGNVTSEKRIGATQVGWRARAFSVRQAGQRLKWGEMDENGGI